VGNAGDLANDVTLALMLIIMVMTIASPTADL